MIRVLHVIPSVGPQRGGPSVALRKLAGALAASGVHVDVATTDDDGRGKLAVVHGKPIVDDGVTFRFFSRQVRFYTVSLPLGRWVARHARDYDVVHIHALFSYSTGVAAHAARLANVPYIVRPVGSLNPWGMNNRRPLVKKLSFRFLESQVIRDSACVHYTSDLERSAAESLVGDARGVVIPNPVMDSAGLSGTADASLKNGRTILFVGRLDRVKGLDLLVRAIALVREQVPDVRLIVGGSGDAELATELQTLAAELNITSHIEWAGFLDAAAKVRVFATADVAALPSYSENFGVAAAEAMGAGLPVIVSDQVGLHADVTRSRSGLVVPCDHVELAQALQQLLTNDPMRQQMATNARAFAASHYSTGGVARQLLGLYQELSTARHSSRVH